MPLRDHFRPPLDNVASWEGFHGGWPMVIVQQLRKLLPAGYVAEPRVHLGSRAEIDVAADETDAATSGGYAGQGDGGVATAVWAPAAPSVAVECRSRTTTNTRSRFMTSNGAAASLLPSKSSAPGTRIGPKAATPSWPSARCSCNRVWPSASSIW